MKKGHGKPVDMWSLGVITYTLLCGYSPFRSENLQDLIDECSNGKVVFHERYWRDVSDDAKDFIMRLLQPNPEDRWSSKVCRAHLPPQFLRPRINNLCSKHLSTPGSAAKMPQTTTYFPRSRPTWPRQDSVVASNSSN